MPVELCEACILRICSLPDDLENRLTAWCLAIVPCSSRRIVQGSGSGAINMAQVNMCGDINLVPFLVHLRWPRSEPHSRIALSPNPTREEEKSDLAQLQNDVVPLLSTLFYSLLQPTHQNLGQGGWA